MTWITITLAITSGLCFAAWPLLIKESSINAYASPFMMSAIVSSFCLPFAIIMGYLEHRATIRWEIPVIVLVALVAVIFSFQSVFSAKISGFNHGVAWNMVVLAALASATGLILCNIMFSSVPKAQVAMSIGFMIVIQFAGTAIYHIAVTGTMSVRHAIGFSCAILACLFLR